MKTKRDSRMQMLLTAILGLGLVLLLAGCSEDDPTGPQQNDPDPIQAASLTKSAQAPGAISENLEQLEMFQNPMSSLAEDAGIYQETPLGDWTGDGLSFPDKSAQAAADFRGAQHLADESVRLCARKAQHIEKFKDVLAAREFGKDEGDTISVEYFDGPDTTGVNALIETATPDVVRFVSELQFTVQFGQVARRDQEIVIDTKGTLENDADDEYHSVFHEEEMAGGEVATGTLNPVSGSGPMVPGVQVKAVHHVEDPRFHLLQEWTEAEVILDIGDFRTEDDETYYSLEGTVHWRNDAEHHAIVEVPGGGAIELETIVEARGSFTAAPANMWLESVNDTLRVQMGDLDDEDDDLLIEASRGAVFDGTAVDGGNPRSYIHFEPEEPVSPGDEPCGGEAEQEIYYPETWWVVHILREADIDCDGSGSLHLFMEMRDGSSYERWITWDGSGTATVSEDRQDGTSVTGTFNESNGEYSLQTTYPAGNDPVSRDQHGQIQEGSITAWDITAWQDAHADSTYFAATGDETSFNITGYRVDSDLREDYTLDRQEDGTLDGTWTRNDGASGAFTIEELEGGGSHLTFSASNPSEEGEPSVTGEIWFAPDGSGTGTVTFTQHGVSITYTITFGPDGTGTMTDGDGNEIAI